MPTGPGAPNPTAILILVASEGRFVKPKYHPLAGIVVVKLAPFGGTGSMLIVRPETMPVCPSELSVSWSIHCPVNGCPRKLVREPGPSVCVDTTAGFSGWSSYVV